MVEGKPSLFSDAREKVEDGLAAHYASGDYVPLGMALQDVATEILIALRLAEAQELRGPSCPVLTAPGRVTKIRVNGPQSPEVIAAIKARYPDAEIEVRDGS